MSFQIDQDGSIHAICSSASDHIVFVCRQWGLYAPDLQGSSTKHPRTFILCHIRRRGALFVWDSFLLRFLDCVSVCLLAEGGSSRVCVAAMDYVAFSLHLYIFATADIFFLCIFRLLVEVRLIGLIVKERLVVTAEAVVSSNCKQKRIFGPT